MILRQQGAGHCLRGVVRSLGLVAVSAALAVSGGSADAQPAPARGSASAPRVPTSKQLEQARLHFEAAEAAKARREYHTAAVEYLAAYEQFQEPEFFYNMAEVYRLTGDEQNALSYYGKYLELDPSGRGAATARGRAAELRRAIAVRQDALARVAAEEERKRKAIATPTAVAAPKRPERGLRIAGLTTGGIGVLSLGVLSLGVGVMFFSKVKSIEDEVSRDAVYRPARYADGRAAERNMLVFTSAGAAALVTGGVLYYLGHRAERSAAQGKSPAVTLAPAISPTHFALAAAGRF